MKEINSLSRKYGFKVIEDASHALGSKSDKSKIGSCKYSDFTIFSFQAIKHITSGDGGAICIRNKNLAKKAYVLRTQRCMHLGVHWYNQMHGFNCHCEQPDA